MSDRATGTQTESWPAEKKRRRAIELRLAELYPGTASDLCELDFDGAFQLGVATILSAQCTDVVVNSVIRRLFSKYPDAQSLAVANTDEVEEIIRPTGFFRNKAKNIVGFANGLLDEYAGQVPSTIDELVRLPGVGRKTANVVVTVAFDKPGIAVDTHVQRLSRRLGLTTSSDPVKIESELMSWLDPLDSGSFGLRLILHGRRVCTARRPECSACALAELCPSNGMKP